MQEIKTFAVVSGKVGIQPLCRRQDPLLDMPDGGGVRIEPSHRLCAAGTARSQVTSHAVYLCIECGCADEVEPPVHVRCDKRLRVFGVLPAAFGYVAENVEIYSGTHQHGL